MKRMILGLMIMLMMLATVSAIGLRTNLATPMVIHRNLTVGEIVTGEIKGANKNEFPITVTLSVPENKTIELSGTLVELQPEETFTFTYTKIVEESETINVGVKYSTTFEDADPKEFNLGSSLTFLIGRDETVPKEETPEEEVIEPVENETVTPEPTTIGGSSSSTKKKKSSSGGSSSGGGNEYDRPVVLDEPEVNLTETPEPLNETQPVINVTQALENTTVVIAPAPIGGGTAMPVNDKESDEDKSKTDKYLLLTFKMLGGLVLLIFIWVLFKSISKGGEVEKMPEEQSPEDEDIDRQNE
jgi:hypothetical protein